MACPTEKERSRQMLRLRRNSLTVLRIQLHKILQALKLRLKNFASTEYASPKKKKMKISSQLPACATTFQRAVVIQVVTDGNDVPIARFGLFRSGFGVSLAELPLILTHAGPKWGSDPAALQRIDGRRAAHPGGSCSRFGFFFEN